jgi:arylsulfatase A-like enzyme
LRGIVMTVGFLVVAVSLPDLMITKKGLPWDASKQAGGTEESTPKKPSQIETAHQSFVGRAVLLAARVAATRRPNIVVIVADDQGWGDLSINGNRNLSTPNIDSLAREGALFEHFYVSALCAPTRAELLTGRYHPRGGVRGVTAGAERLNTSEKTIADYVTGAFGKWHNGSQYPYHPNARGFDEYYGFTHGHWGHYFSPELDHNGRLVRGKGFLPDDLTDHAIEFITNNRDKRFFCYMPLNTPHSPMQVPDRFYRKFASLDPVMKNVDPTREDILMTRAALAMVENIDWNVGRLLARLDQLNLRDKTIVLYLSDNGPNSWRWNGGMKGRKGSVDEGGLRSPLFIRWPGHIRPATCITPIAGAIDLLPTLADLADVPVVSDKPLDGKSLRPLLDGETAAWPDRMLFSIQDKRVSVRTQQYRLDPDGRLYDITADPGQTTDIATQKPKVAALLVTARDSWATKMLPLVGPDDRPFPVGHVKTTLLPARDGVPSGGVRRSSRHPNDSFFTEWTSKAGRMTWDVEVARPGRYEAVLHYTCPAADVGSTIELSLGTSRTSAKIAEPHDPSLVGASQDRAPRTESYVKDFRPMPLGALALPSGRGELTLRTLEVSGGHVADVRYVVLTRLD